MHGAAACATQGCRVGTYGCRHAAPLLPPAANRSGRDEIVPAHALRRHDRAAQQAGRAAPTSLALHPPHCGCTHLTMAAPTLLPLHAPCCGYSHTHCGHVYYYLYGDACCSCCHARSSTRRIQRCSRIQSPHCNRMYPTLQPCAPQPAAVCISRRARAVPLVTRGLQRRRGVGGASQRRLVPAAIRAQPPAPLCIRGCSHVCPGCGPTHPRCLQQDPFNPTHPRCLQQDPFYSSPVSGVCTAHRYVHSVAIVRRPWVRLPCTLYCSTILVHRHLPVSSSS